jgi:hypothetical protein
MTKEEASIVYVAAKLFNEKKLEHLWNALINF